MCSVVCMMCGILCCFSRSDSFPVEELCKYCHDALLRRGQDVSGSSITKLQNGWKACFFGYVLWTQGPYPTPQPLQDEEGNCLLWNGDIFNVNQNSNSICDAVRVFNMLKDESSNVVNVLSELCGPYAFVFWNNKAKCLWFGRDVIGRQSLLWDCNIDHFIIASVGHKSYGFDEVPSCGIYMIDFSGKNDIELNVYQWNHLNRSIITNIGKSGCVNIVYKNPVNHVVLGDGGCSMDWCHKGPSESELFVYKNFSGTDELMERLLHKEGILRRVKSFVDILMAAVRVRVTTNPGMCKNCTDMPQSCTHSCIGILFSGGLDSTVLALLADKYVPLDQPIDLYNVAFENHSSSVSGFNVPDRKSGEKSLEELTHLAPRRTWNFIKIDVTQRELKDCRDHIIRHLIHPLSSVLDDSLGCALWFASRGEGLINGTLYKSPARIVLLGMGADEQLGGYMRHRNVFRRGDWVALSSELRHDFERIGLRNLGRDNRVIADHGRQPRIPYLDEYVVAYISKLPPWQRCMLIPTMPPGVGDKLILRLAAWHLGLRYAAVLPKRALQFGSRIASNKENGSDHSYRL